MSELDRILLDDTGPDPSASFSGRVMASIRAEDEVHGLSKGLLIILVGLFVTLVGIPLTVLTAEGFQVVGGEDLSTKLLWIGALVVVTFVAAVLPVQLLES